MRYSKYFILPVALACFYGCVDEDFADHSGSQHANIMWRLLHGWTVK